MSMILLFIALLGFVAIGLGASLLRANERPALSGGWQAVVRAWFRTLQAQRLAGATLIAIGALTIILVMVFRP